MSITTRSATAADKEFLITTIIEAEKGGSDIISYCAMFGISEAELRVLLDKILDEDIPGQELCISGFMVAEENGEYAGAMSTWVEGLDGLPSGLIKANLLRSHIDRDKLMASMPLMKLVSDANLEREKGVIHGESGYVVPKFRGRGVLNTLSEAQIERWKERGVHAKKLIFIPMLCNEVAVNIYTSRMGFKAIKTKTVQDPKILTLLPGDTRILLERKID